MTIEAKIILRSFRKNGPTLTTYQLKYPRFIHGELMTHRVFSRNASSSRAIPTAKIIQAIKDDPAMPVHWGRNQTGMQARAELGQEEVEKCKSLWLEARDEAIEKAEKMLEIGLHKQVANRIIEPWSHIHVIVTATEWDNWFRLRAHPDAQPEIRVLAEEMLKQECSPRVQSFVSEAAPKKSTWHLPYIKMEEHEKYRLKDLIRMSVARCARVSYMNHDGTDPIPEKDFELHDRLVVAEPEHMSPAEHQAVVFGEDPNKFYGNFKGWKQYRKFIEEGLVL